MKLIAFVLLSFGLSLYPNIQDLRDAYFVANSESGSKAFLEITDKVDPEDPVHMAYRGASLAMSAGFSNGIMDRLERFSDGKELLEKAVELQPTNPEIRFVRYCIQANVPAIVFYSDNLDEDYEIIVDHVRTTNRDAAFWKKALKAMKDSEKTKDSRQDQISKLLNTI
jgi:hypothetical protein